MSEPDKVSKTKSDPALNPTHINEYSNLNPMDLIKKDRALKIIKEMSEFLRILDLRESEILKTMIVRFAIESIEASQGSLIVAHNNILRYQDTFVYDSNNKIILDTSIFQGYSDLLDVEIQPGEGISGQAFLNGSPILVQNIENSGYKKPVVGKIMKIDIGSVIVMPLKINNEIISLLEINNDKNKPPFNENDLETIMIIANFASTILENAKLFMWAIHDSLTNLFNNHYFYKELSDEIDKSKRYSKIFSLAIIDVDNFKSVNDTYGHSSGDRALQALADSIRKTVRKDVDIASRYGGDEFVIVFPNTTAENAFKICERLLIMVRNNQIKASDNREFGFTLSMGIAEFPKDGNEIYFLFNHADEALYQSKKKGKNTITIYRRD